MSAALLFGLWPALRAVRRDATVRLREATPGAGVRRGLAGRALIAGQLALSLLLLVVAGLFMRALDRGGRVDPGFDTGGIAVVSLEPEAWGYDEAGSRAFYDRLRERVATMPGVISVSSSNRVPLMFGQSVDQIDVGGRAVPAHYVAIAPGYFQTLRLPLAQGRDFVESDGQTAPRVAIVNQTMAQRVWPGGALGQTFRYQDEVTTVIGVARDAKYASLDETAPAFVYFPIAQVWRPTQVLLVRTAGAPETLGGSLQDAVVALDPLIARPRVTTMARATAIVLLPQRAAALVTGVLGAAGLLMAAVGLYGILAYAASRRTREIGVRMALGAGRRDVVSMMVAEGMWLSAVGVAAGLAAATAATRLVSPWLFGVSPLDAGTFAGMSAVLLAVAWLASYLPARRAARADPAAVLKAE